MMLKDTVRSPGKLYEYFGAQKPILVCAPDGVIRRTAMESKAAISVDPDNVSEIEKAIDTYYSLWLKNSLPKPSSDFIEQFNRQKLTGDLARELALSTEL